MSMKLTPAAATSTSSWPGPGLGSWRSAACSTSGPPCSVTTTACMEPSLQMPTMVLAYWRWRMAATGTAADADLAKVYRDLHAHPELGFGETRTAAIVAGRLRSLGFQTATGVGRTGVVGVLRNGTGPA